MKTNVNTKRRRLSLEQVNYKRLLSCKGDFSSLSISFKNHDNTIRRMNMNPEFTKDSKGKKLRIGDIIENINALKHDLGAKNFLIMK